MTTQAERHTEDAMKWRPLEGDWNVPDRYLRPQARHECLAQPPNCFSSRRAQQE